MANDNDLNQHNKAPTYTHNSISEIKEKLVKLMLKSQHGRSDALDIKIEAAWLVKYGFKFSPLRKKGELPLPLLHGSSGIGKSRIIDGACIDVAEMLEMDIYVNPKGKRSFGPNDMVVGKLNFKASGDLPFLLTGMVSVNDVKLDDGSDASYTTVVPNDTVYAVSENAGAGMRILFVDEVNSGDVASAAFMALNDNDLGGGIDVGGTFLIGAGNLGEDDGNIASANPVSMSSRAWNFLVEADLDGWKKDFIEPIYLSDTIGDYGVSLYLSLNKDKFSETPPKASEIEGVSTVYGMPRTWSQFITVLESQYQDPQELAAAGIEAISQDGQGIVGPAARGYAEFAYNLWTGVTPMVNEFMSNEGPSAETIAKFKERQGNGRGQLEKEFIHQWAYQTSLTTANLLVQNLEGQGIQDGYDVTDKKAQAQAEEVFSEVGKRFGLTISGIVSRGMQNKTIADLVNEMSRITLTQMPWLNQNGKVLGNLRASFAEGVVTSLKKHGAPAAQIQAISAIFFDDKTKKVAMTRKEGESKPSSTKTL